MANIEEPEDLDLPDMRMDGQPKVHVNTSDHINVVPHTHMIEISGSDWLIGFSWESIEEPLKRREIKERARELSADVAVQRAIDGVVQVGYGSEVDNLTPNNKVRSLAAAVAAGVQQPWLGIYQISDQQYWYIAVRDSFQIMPNSDIVADLETVEMLRKEHRGLSGDWTEKIGNFNDLTMLIEQIATDSPKVFFVNHNYAKKYLIGCAVLALLGGSYYAYRHHEYNVHRAKELAQLHREEMRKHKIDLAKMKPPPSPDTHRAMPNSVVNACFNALDPIPYSIHGWSLFGVSCSNLGYGINWIRGKTGNVADAPPGQLTKTGNKIVFSSAFHLPQKSNDNSVDIYNGVKRLYSILQYAGVKPKVVQINMPKHTKIRIVKKKVVFPPIPTARVEFVWPVIPTGVNWNSIPGYRISSIVKTTRGWDIKGTIYGKRIYHR